MTRTKRSLLRGLTSLVPAALLAAGMNVAHANSIGKQNFLDLVNHSESIVVGTVAGKTDGIQAGLPYTEITLEVGRSLKGQHGARYSFRQFGLIEPKATGDGRVNLMVTPAGWPTYAKGEQVLLFLHAPGSETGFRTTAGLVQGKFTIRGDRIANAIDNESLFAGMKINADLPAQFRDLVNQPGGSYSAEAFISLVQQAVEENWIENGVMTDEN